MRAFILTILTGSILTSLLVQELKAQGQDPITQYDGIPLVVYSWRYSPWMDNINFAQMKEMGVFAAISGDPLNKPLNDPDLTRFANNDLKVIPIQRWNPPNDIFTYTDANYTIWEAEGTDPSKGKVTLYHSSNSVLFQEGSISGVKAEGPNVPAGETIILGPGYPQNGTYRLNDNFVRYFAEYRMKIEQRTTPPPGYQNDVVCTLMVTNLADDPSLTESTVISKVVTVSEFNGWDNWRGIQISDPLGYTLQGHTFDYNRSPKEIESYKRANCIQFKVIWAGLDYLNLYVDRIRVYDLKGDLIVNNENIQDLIATNMVTHYINHDLGETIIGWYAIDEPPSIDNYEPFRVVDHIIDSISRAHSWPMRLHTGFTGGNTGTYSNWNVIDTFALNKFQDVEFWLRAKPKNIQINMYNYHYPYNPSPNHPAYWALWQTENIGYVTRYLDRINDYDSSFAFSTQSGGWYSYDGCNEIEELIIPSPSQINYHINLGLMYGAKELRLDPFFTHRSYDSTCAMYFYRTRGLIDEFEEPTANYYFFKYTLIPRLNGWFGKTLKRLNQFKQFPNINALVDPESTIPYEFVDYVKVTGGPNDICKVDLGIFEDMQNLSAKYFMLVNRYYSNKTNLTIGLKDLTEYINWNVTDYIDTTHFTLIPSNGKAEFTENIYPGDAKLYSVLPVILYGGTLIANETAGEGQVLNGDMIIDNGVTLSIWGNYYAEGDIIVKSGSIVNEENGKIIFKNGKKLIIDGPAIVNGTISDKLTLDFTSSNYENGIVIEEGTLHLSYCEIKKASAGVIAQPGSGYISIQHSEFINCSSAGIILLGSSTEGPQAPPPQQFITAQ